MPYFLKKYYPWRNLFFVIGEGLLIFLIINSVFLMWSDSADFSELLPMFAFRAIVVTFVFQICFYYFDLYDYTIIPEFSDHLLKVIQTFGVACIGLAFLYYFFPFLSISTRIFLSGLFAAGLAIIFWRLFYFQVLEQKMFAKPIALIGTGKFAGEITAAIDSKKDSGFKIAALVGNRDSSSVPLGLPVFSSINELWDLCKNRTIEKIVLALDERRGQLPMNDLIQFKFLGIEILDAVPFYERLTGKIIVERVNPSWMLFSSGFYIGRMTRMFKRSVDLLVASFLLIISSPVIALSALIIRFESPGGIFYLQERVGRNGKTFNIIKLRSMCADAEKDGPIWASTGDDRVTGYGRFIRKVRIDELPQLINVIKGDMSLVGPRPERPMFVKDLAEKIPYYSIRHVVKPGITGWAQIYYPYGASEDDALRKLEYDLYYLKNLSIGMDLSTIFQTIKVVLFQKGAR